VVRNIRCLIPDPSGNLEPSMLARLRWLSKNDFVSG